MMMRFRSTIGLVLAALPAMALAQEAAAPEEAKPVTRAEINAKLDSDYADLDADKDGKATPAEINARLLKSAEAELDLYRKKRDETFAKLDTDGNGTISRAEFDAKAPLPKIKEADAKPFLDRFDKDKDGAITQEEFRGPTLANFEKMDGNKDGTVSPAELKAAVKKPAPKQTPPIGR
jgi:Ca2+-binding EF-hand superfamily protein